MKTHIRSINPIDKLVSCQLKLARLQKGMALSAISEKLGVTIQQIQKYESGKNRISCGRLAQLAEALSQPITYFFDNPDPEIQSLLLKEDEQSKSFKDSEIFTLCKAFKKITSKDGRKRVIDLLLTMS